MDSDELRKRAVLLGMEEKKKAMDSTRAQAIYVSLYSAALGAVVKENMEFTYEQGRPADYEATAEEAERYAVAAAKRMGITVSFTEDER